MFLVLPWTVCSYSIQLINKVTYNGIHFYYRSPLTTSWATSSKGFNIRVFLISDQRNCVTSREFLDLTVVQMRSLFLWDMVPHSHVLCAWLFKTTWWSLLEGSECPFLYCTFWLLKLRPPCCLKTSGSSHPLSRDNFPEEGRPLIISCLEC